MQGRAQNWMPHAVDKSPCESGCPNVAQCRAERLACPAFSEYVLEAPWQDVSLKPTAAIYMRIFSGEDNGS